MSRSVEIHCESCRKGLHVELTAPAEEIIAAREPSLVMRLVLYFVRRLGRRLELVAFFHEHEPHGDLRIGLSDA